MNDSWRLDEVHKWLYMAAGEWGIGNFFKDQLPADDFRYRFDEAWNHWTFYVGEPSMCGSPIEAIFFAQALFLSDGYTEVQWEPFPGQNPPPDFGTWFRTQENIGRHRVDFLFTCYCRGKTRRLAVECDGHDFHERTKEQAARDRSRDREITLSGATVIRFTGSELYRDPMKCAAEVSALLTSLLEDAMVEAGVIDKKRGR